MAWITVTGLSGKVYQPEGCHPEQGKHPCQDCFQCLHCGEERCQVCRAEQDTNRTGARVKAACPHHREEFS